jgi:alkyl sulfatase BDS1-like metallo-beta-lactamase superfamily hydrolase
MASEIVNKLVQADPNIHPAKDLLADIFEQLGYQQESPGPRKQFSRRRLRAKVGNSARRSHQAAPT